MKMGTIEKWFVNSTSHSQQVSQHFERLLNKIEVSEGQRYLDVGCGNGAAPIDIARTYGLAVTGIDVDSEQIALAQAQSENLANIRFLTQDGQRLPFQNDEFDIVATNKVMHHIAAWPVAFAEMARVLKPGGYLIFADLVVPTWVATIGQTVVKERVGFPTQTAIEALAGQHGLVPVYKEAGTVSYEAIFQAAQVV